MTDIVMEKPKTVKSGTDQSPRAPSGLIHRAISVYQRLFPVELLGRHDLI